MLSGVPLVLFHKETDVLNAFKVINQANWRQRFTEIDLQTIIDFALSLQRECPNALFKYDKKICTRFSQLNEIKYEPDTSKYNARSRDTYIIFYKNLPSPQHEYVLYHELIHFLQSPDSEFEKVPLCVQKTMRKRDIPESDINSLLFEEAYAQYMASMLHGFPNKKAVECNGSVRWYWMNDCYSLIVGYMDEICDVIGKDAMLMMFLDDDEYDHTCQVQNSALKYI